MEIKINLTKEEYDVILKKVKMEELIEEEDLAVVGDIFLSNLKL